MHQSTLLLFRIPSFATFFVAEIAICLATSMFFVASVWLGFQVGGTSVVAAMLIISSIPAIVFGPAVGLLVDRLDRLTLATGINSWRCASVVAAIVLISTWGLQPAFIYAVAFANAIGDAAHVPTWRALLVEIVGETNLLAANSALVVGGQLAMLAGAASGGLLVEWIGYKTAFTIIAVGFAAASLLSFVMSRARFRRGRYCASEITMRRTPPSLIGAWEDVAAGFKFLLAERYVLRVYLVMLALFVFLRVINAILAPFVGHSLHLQAGAFGIIDAGFAIGAVLGALVLPGATARMPGRKLWVSAILALALATFVFSLAENVLECLTLYIVMGILYQVNTALQTETQRVTPRLYQGRVVACFNATATIIGLGVYISIGMAHGDFDFRLIYAAVAALLAASTASLAGLSLHAIGSHLEPYRGEDTSVAVQQSQKTSPQHGR